MMNRCVVPLAGTYNEAAITYNLTRPCMQCPTGQTTASTGSTSINNCFSKYLAAATSCCSTALRSGTNCTPQGDAALPSMCHSLSKASAAVKGGVNSLGLW
jgi:hypothetical protein